MQKLVPRQVVPALVAGVMLSLAPAVQAAPKSTTHKLHAQPATLGTTQMAGGQALLGHTYTYDAPYPIGQPINLTITSVEYAVGRINFNAEEDHFAPTADQKLVLIHYRIKNPNKDDIAFLNYPLFQTVDGDGTTNNVPNLIRRESGRDEVTFHLKPGQGIDDFVSYTILPAKARLSKLIVIYGRVGTHDKVTRFTLGAAPNTVQPIPALFADPSDTTGATPLAVVPAKIGTPYAAGFFDLTLDAAAYAPGPFGDTTADDGMQFLVATVTVTNRAWQPLDYRDGTQTLSAVLKTDDDEKTTKYVMLKGKRDEAFNGDKLTPDDPRTIRLLFQIPKNAKATSLSLAESYYSGTDYSHALLYDLSGAQ